MSSSELEEVQPEVQPEEMEEVDEQVDEQEEQGLRPFLPERYGRFAVCLTVWLKAFRSSASS